jgi:nucleotide-binding universal stress UspA family protein
LKILLFCKNSDANKKALQIALEQAKAFDASIQMVSCITDKPGVPSEVTEKAAKKAEKKMQEYTADIFDPAGIVCNSEVIVTATTIGEQIVRYAERIAADTIIMSIQKRSKIGKMVFGSNSQIIILEAPCKVITIA